MRAAAFEYALMVVDRSGESALAMAEELGLDQQVITLVSRKNGCTTEKSVTVTREEEVPQWSWEWLVDQLAEVRREQR